MITSSFNELLVVAIELLSEEWWLKSFAFITVQTFQSHFVYMKAKLHQNPQRQSLKLKESPDGPESSTSLTPHEPHRLSAFPYSVS